MATMLRSAQSAVQVLVWIIIFYLFHTVNISIGTQPSIQCVPEFFPGGKSGLSVKLIIHFPDNIKVKNAFSCTSAITIRVHCHDLTRKNFTLFPSDLAGKHRDTTAIRATTASSHIISSDQPRGLVVRVSDY